MFLYKYTTIHYSCGSIFVKKKKILHGALIRRRKKKSGKILSRAIQMIQCKNRNIHVEMTRAKQKRYPKTFPN